jgi:CheY-like chemotaxis protein
MLLANRTVLVVDADSAVLEVLSAELKGHGAKCFPAQDAATATWGARETLPDAVVCTLELANMDASELVAELRGAPEASELAAIGLTATPALAGSLRARPPVAGAGFEKFLVRLPRISELVDALCSVFGTRTLPERGNMPSVELLAQCVERRDFRHLLAALNATTTHRFSAFFRRQGVELASVWTFDRERPRLDPFPLRLPIAATPCATLLLTERPLHIEDVWRDRGVPLEQQLSEMRAFVGVPLIARDRTPFGVLCHFDPAPRAAERNAEALLELTATLLCKAELRGYPR